MEAFYEHVGILDSCMKKDPWEHFGYYEGVGK